MKKATIFFWTPILDFGELGNHETNIQARLYFDDAGDFESMDFQTIMVLTGGEPLDLTALHLCSNETEILALKAQCLEAYHLYLEQPDDALTLSKIATEGALCND